MEFKRITKTEARELFNKGKRIYLLPSKMSPSNPWMQPHGSVKSEDSFTNFDELCNSYSYYNCTNELGRSIRFYKEVKICCICHKEFEGWGNNPWPLNNEDDARCCDECNTLVIFARLIGNEVN